MPIFTSRFSPERSLIGTFLSTRSRETEDAESRAPNRRTNSASTSQTPQDEDRLDLTGAQQTTLAVAQARSSDPSKTQTGDSTENRQILRQFGLQKVLRESALARANLQASARTPIQTTQSPEAKTTSLAGIALAVAQENGAASRTAAPARLNALNTRLAEVRQESAQQAVQDENELAAQNATPERLDNLAAQTQAGDTPLAAPTDSANEKDTPLSAAQQKALAERLANRLERQAPAAQPEREEQQAGLRRDLQSIASGLQADAAIKSRRTVEQTARTTQDTVQNNQRATIRENQTEIRSLQTSRRQLQQETQRTDQAIRQLQNENARLKNGNGATAPTTTIDILAQ